jgi:hypothetical protein
MGIRQMEALLDEFGALPVRRVPCEFNILQVLGIASKEVRHNHLLRWLLDPQGTHGQGALFLAVFMRLCRHPLQPGVLERCRAKHGAPDSEPATDVIIECRDDLLVYVENKIYADEGERQLAEQLYDLRRRGNERGVPEGDQIAVFLTPDGRDPKDGPGPWRPVSHRDLAQSFGSVVPRVRDRKLAAFVQDWLRSLESQGGLGMADPSAESLLVARRWTAFEAIEQAADDLAEWLGASLLPLEDRLASLPGWSEKQWRFSQYELGTVILEHKAWGIGTRNNVLAIGLRDFTPGAVFGADALPALFVWVKENRPSLASSLARAMARKRLRLKGDEVNPDAPGGYIVQRHLGRCSADDPGGYIERVQQEALEFMLHYGGALVDLNDVIQANRR